MADARFSVVVSAGSLQPHEHQGVVMSHQWTDGGVVVEAAFTGGHLYQLAAAGCVLNDVYREADQLGIAVEGVRVRASGGFDTTNWTSTGVEYEIEIESPANEEEVNRLIGVVDDVAEIPKALRSGASVTRGGHG